MKHISHSLDQLLEGLGIQNRVRENQALVVWGEVVGDRIAKVTEPERVSNGVLFVRVQSASWKAELIHCKRQIIEKITRRIGKEVIHDIVFR